METTVSLTPPRSTLVTVVAWVFIVLSLFTTAGSLLQNIMFFRLSAMEGIHEPMHQGMMDMPLPLQFIFDHYQLFLAAILALSLAGLVSSVGLLRRKNWARRLFSVLLACGIVSLLTGFAVQFSLTPVTDNIPASQLPADAQTMFRVMKGFLFILTLSFSLLLGGIIAMLTWGQAREEFL